MAIEKLKAKTLPQIYDEVYTPQEELVEDLLYSGVNLLVGSPKVGKSFLAAQIAYHVATGLSLWDLRINSGTVLYLALEDDFSRIQRRMSMMFGVSDVENIERLHFVIKADFLNNGLITQLEDFIKENPDTKLIIIDTLQKIKMETADSVGYSYSKDYSFMSVLKEFQARHNICLLLIHHTRKMDAEDCFDKISGTNGILGAADGAFIMIKKKRTDLTATLHIIGRDQQEQELTIERTPNCYWKLCNKAVETLKVPDAPLLEAINRFVTKEKCWKGTATDLLTALNVTGLTPNILSRKLNAAVSILYNRYGIVFNRGSNGNRFLELKINDNSFKRNGI